MDLTLIASQPLRDDTDFLANMFAEPELVVVGEVGEVGQKGVGEIDWTLVVQLLEKGAITGIGGLAAQTAAKKAWKGLSAALKRVRRRAVDEQRRASLTVEILTDQGVFMFHLPTDPQEVGEAVEEIPVHIAAGGHPGFRRWLDGRWVDEDI